MRRTEIAKIDAKIRDAKAAGVVGEVIDSFDSLKIEKLRSLEGVFLKDDFSFHTGTCTLASLYPLSLSHAP